jgi:hypothetical protein
MISNKEIMGAYEIHCRALAEANALNKTAVFDALASAGITCVVVTFDGEGDSGQIERVQAYAQKGDTKLPFKAIEVAQAAWNAQKLDISSVPLAQAIETLSYDYLEQEHGGWENNDGAYGEFTFHVAERRIELSFNGRFTDSFLSSHTF